MSFAYCSFTWMFGLFPASSTEEGEFLCAHLDISVERGMTDFVTSQLVWSQSRFRMQLAHFLQTCTEQETFYV